jgi:hypothetical protein
MKKFITLLSLTLVVGFAQAQISTFPYTQTFDTPIAGTIPGMVANNVTIYPNWVANLVRDTISRIHTDTIRERTGMAAIAAIPTSTAKDTLKVSLNMTTWQSGQISFWACSDSLGSLPPGNRSARVFINFSTDGGVTYGTPISVGDTIVFARYPTPYQQYSFTMPATANNMANVIVRLNVDRGTSAGMTGTAARYIMDDFMITAVPFGTGVSTIAQQGNDFVAYPNPTKGLVSLALANVNADTYINVLSLTGKQLMTQKVVAGATTAQLNLQNLSKGTYLVTLSNKGIVTSKKVVVE